MSEANLNFNDTFLINNSFINSNANYEINKCMLNHLDNDLVEEFKKEIINNVLSHIESSNIINCSYFMAIVFDINDENPNEQLKNGISAIDLGNCTNKIKEFYNINDFIVLNIESKNNNNENVNYIGKNNQINMW